ncbi:MAG: WbqC family protein [Bacteroidota bacterium]
MILAAHEPGFLPWLGYLDRMRQADLFIVLDHLPYNRCAYHNRARILLNGLPHWLTIPVMQGLPDERIVDKRIAYPAIGRGRWGGCKLVRTLRYAYRQAPFFDVYAPGLLEILASRPRRLVDLDRQMLTFLRMALDIRTPLINSSELNITGSRSQLIVNLCLAAGADTYLAGMGRSRHYLDQSAFAAAGIKISWPDFQHPVYGQGGNGAFVPGLSAIDLLFNHGPQSRQLLGGQLAECHPASFPRRAAVTLQQRL